MVPVQIVGIRPNSLTGTTAVLLGDPDQLTRILPIMMCSAEAQSIASSLSGSVPPRPGTHDLAITLMGIAGSRLEEVVITERRGRVFFAELFVETADGMQSVSARPSDGIALAVRVGAPVFVRERVLDAAAVHLDRDPHGPLSEEEIDTVVEEFQAFLEAATPDDSVVEPWIAHEGGPQEEIGWMDDD